MSRNRSNKSRYKQRSISRDNQPPIPELKDGDVRIITLGGFEEIGRNMSVVEFGDDIIVIDAGFQFKDEDMPGIDYVLPNTKYLEDRKDKIRAVFITHGHLDHIGGIPYIMERLGNPPIYCRSFTRLMILKRQEEFPNMPPLDIHIVDTKDKVQVGDLDISFFGITHTIPDSMGIVVNTPYGNIVNQADFKLDHVDGTVSEEEQEEYDRIAQEDTLLMMADSTNVENEGFSTPEWKVHRSLEKIIKETNGRIILGAFASQIDRLVKILEFAHEDGRKVVLEGRSMRTNIAVAQRANLITVPDDIFISAGESHDLSPDQVFILATGSQGEEFAALNRMANKTHRHLAFKPEDTVVLSSSVVPGNELSVAALKDNIARTGPTIITYRTNEYTVHGSGHGNREELKWLHKKLKPKFFVPQHGSHYMLRLHEKLAQEVGTPAQNIVVPENGSIIEVQNEGQTIKKLDVKASDDVVTVDGFNIGDVQDVVIRDREILSDDGIFVVIVAVNPKNGKLRKSPDLISRGFVYLRESKELLSETRDLVRKVVKDTGKGRRSINFDHLKSNLTDEVRSFLLNKTGKRPLVIPVVLGV